MKRLLAIGWMFVLAATAPLAAPAAATPPLPPPCVWIGSPLNYATQLLASRSWGIIKDWPIRRLIVPHCRYRNEPFAIGIEFQAPAAYSSKKMNYEITATFVFEDGRITSDETLAAEMAALPERIAAFESDPRIDAYLAIAPQSVIKVYDTVIKVYETPPNATEQRFELSIDIDNRIVYAPAAGRVVEFEFADPRLIAQKELFARLIGTSPIAQEFDRLVGVNYVQLFSEGLVIAQNPPSQCTTCAPYIQLNDKRTQVEYFSVPSHLQWDSLPLIARAHAIIEQQGYDRQQPACAIGRGDIHNYTIGTPADGEIGAFDFEVILVCSNATQPVGWKQVRVHVNADGTFEQPRVVMESISGGFIPGSAH